MCEETVSYLVTRLSISPYGAVHRSSDQCFVRSFRLFHSQRSSVARSVVTSIYHESDDCKSITRDSPYEDK